MFILSTIRENREQRRKGREVLRDLVTPAGIGRYSADVMGRPGKRRATRWAGRTGKRQAAQTSPAAWTRNACP